MRDCSLSVSTSSGMLECGRQIRLPAFMIMSPCIDFYKLNTMIKCGDPRQFEKADLA